MCIQINIYDCVCVSVCICIHTCMYIYESIYIKSYDIPPPTAHGNDMRLVGVTRSVRTSSGKSIRHTLPDERRRLSRIHTNRNTQTNSQRRYGGARDSANPPRLIVCGTAVVADITIIINIIRIFGTGSAEIGGSRPSRWRRTESAA